MLANRTSLITESNTSKMRNKANQLKEKGIPVVNFAAGELDLDTSPDIKSFAETAIEKGKNKYTDTLGIAILREHIAKKVTQDTAVYYSMEEIGVTAGAKQALFNAAFTLFESGDEVIIPAPFWGTFEAQITLTGAKPIIFDTSANQYQIDVTQLKKYINHRTRGLILNSPNNPTGVVYTRDVLHEIACLAIKHDFWIIFDECYENLVYEPNLHHNVVNVLPEVKEKTILINSFSKTYAITGWRIGYLAGPKTVIKAIKDIQGHTTSNPSCIAQYAVLSVFEKDHHAYIKHVNTVLQERLTQAMIILDTIPGITYTKPQGAFYLYPTIKSIIGKAYHGTTIESATDFAEILLEEAHVAVVPGNAFSDPTGFRLSYAISKEEMITGLNNIQRVMTNIYQ